MSNFEQSRMLMVVDQLKNRGIKDQIVLSAMQKVPRHLFLKEDLHSVAYNDGALPIDCEQTISQPYIVALMTEALRIEPNDVVLEIGTGSGYQTAILAEIAKKVITIERHIELSNQAKLLLNSLNYSNIEFHVTDGSVGLLSNIEQFNAIMVTAAAPNKMDHLFNQLVEGGRMVVPAGTKDNQQLYLIEKIAGKSVEKNLGGCRFVPLLGKHGWQ